MKRLITLFCLLATFSAFGAVIQDGPFAIRRGTTNFVYNTPQTAWAAIQNGDVLTIAPGTWSMNVTNDGNTALAGYAKIPLLLSNKINVTIQGSGPSTILRATSYGNLMGIYACSNIVFRDFQLVGDRTVLTGNKTQLTNGLSSPSFWISAAAAHGGTNYVTWDSVTFTDWPDQALSQWSGTYGCGNARGLIVRNCRFRNIGCTAIPYDAPNNKPDGSCISSIVGRDSIIQGNIMENIVRGVECDSGGQVGIGDVARVKIIGNSMTEVYNYGIFLAGDKTDLSFSQFDISDNSVSMANVTTSIGDQGCYLVTANTYGLILSGNTANNAQTNYFGIRIEPEQNGIVIDSVLAANNSINNCRIPIAVIQRTNETGVINSVTITGNKITYPYYGVLIGGPNVNFVNNTISGAGGEIGSYDIQASSVLLCKGNFAALAGLFEVLLDNANAENIYLAGNVFKDNDNSVNLITDTCGTAPLTNVVIINNHAINVGTATNSFPNGTVWTSFADEVRLGHMFQFADSGVMLTNVANGAGLYDSGSGTFYWTAATDAMAFYNSATFYAPLVTTNLTVVDGATTNYFGGKNVMTNLTVNGTMNLDTLNATTLVATNFTWATNAALGGAAIDMSKSYQYTNCLNWDAVRYTSLGTASDSLVQSTVLFLQCSTNKVIEVAIPGVRSVDGIYTNTINTTSNAVISIVRYGNTLTNMAFKVFRP